MKIESHGWMVSSAGQVPPRTFVELSEEEAMEALRRYVCEEGLDLPCGRAKLMTPDGAPRAAGFVLLVEHVSPTLPLFEQE